MVKSFLTQFGPNVTLNIVEVTKIERPKRLTTAGGL